MNDVLNFSFISSNEFEGKIVTVNHKNEESARSNLNPQYCNVQRSM